MLVRFGKGEPEGNLAGCPAVPVWRWDAAARIQHGRVAGEEGCSAGTVQRQIGLSRCPGHSVQGFFLSLHLFSMLMSHLPSPPDTVQWGKVPLPPTSAALLHARSSPANSPLARTMRRNLPEVPEAEAVGDAPWSSIAQLPPSSEVPMDKIPLRSEGAQTSSAQIKAAFAEDGNATDRTLIPGFRFRREGTFALIFSLPF